MKPITNDDTALTVTAYQDGKPFILDVVGVECGHHLAKTVVYQARTAIRAAREHGLTVSISSAWRSMEKQQELYEGHKKGLPGFNPAERPGFSKHQDGTAIDLAFKSGEEREEFFALALAHGFVRTHRSEAWHFEIVPHTDSKEAA